MANMNTTQEIAAIIESVANKRATFDEVDMLGNYSGEEMDEYLKWLGEA